MKTTPVSILLAAFLGTHPAIAGDPPRKDRPEGTPPGHQFLDAWKKADQNGDDSLSFTEFSSLPRLQTIPDEKRTQLFQRLDKDRNGLITLKEMRRLGPPPQGGPNHRKRLWELDADQNGHITREEFSTGELFQKLPPDKQRKLFDRLDSNQDGTISPEDRPERPGPHPGGRPRTHPPEEEQAPRGPILFPKLDTNNDGSLDFGEFSQMPGISRLGEDAQEKAFESIDANRDLKINPQEIKQFRPSGRFRNKAPQTDKPHRNPPHHTVE